jgi:PAS domain S-box-containing protein
MTSEPSIPPVRPSRLWLVPLAAVVLVIVAIVTLPLSLKVHALLEAASSVGAALVFVPVLRRPTRATLPWTLLAGYVVLGAIAAVIWTADVLAGGGSAVNPLPADVLWLLGDGFLAATFATLTARREGWGPALIDAAGLAISLGVVAIAFLVLPYLDATELPGRQTWLHVAYVVLDVVVLVFAVRLLLSPRPRQPAALLAFGGAVAYLASDFVWHWLTLTGTFIEASWTDAGWIVAPAIIAAAVLHPSRDRTANPARIDADRASPLGAVLLGIGCMSGPATWMVQEYASLIPVHAERAAAVAIVLDSMMLGALVCARVFALLRQSRDYAARLGVALDRRSRLLDVSEERYRDLVEQLPAVLYILRVTPDGDMPPVYMSPQAGRMLGIDHQAVLADPALLWSRVNPHDRAEMHESARWFTGEADNPARLFRFEKPDGTQLWLRTEQRVFQAEDGEFYLQGIMLDITPQKDAEAQRDQMEVDLRLAQKLEAVGSLAAGIAHEINTPIQFVGDTVNFLDDAFGDLLVLIQDYRALHRAAAAGMIDSELVTRVSEAEQEADFEYLEARVPEACQRAQEGVDRVARIVRAMRDFAHAPTSEQAATDLNDGIRNTLVVAASEYKYIAEMETDLAELPPVMANAGDINQAVLNLIVNAAHAIADVVGESGELGRISVSSRVDGEDVVISVSDSGCGVPAEIAARIFDPFFTTKDVGRGTGQGLAIVRSIVTEKHEGGLTFENAAGGGATFHVRLPIAGVNPQVEALAA